MRVLVLAALLASAGCSLTPQQRFGIVTAVLVTGAVIAHQHDSGKPQRRPTPSVDCSTNPELCR